MINKQLALPLEEFEEFLRIIKKNVSDDIIQLIRTEFMEYLHKRRGGR